MKLELTALAITCFGCNARGFVKQTLIRNRPDEKPVFCAVDDEGGFWKLETTGVPDGWREGHARRPLCPTCPDAAARPPAAPAEPPKNVQPIAHQAAPPNVRPNSITVQQGVQTVRTLGAVRGAPAVSIPPQPAAAGGQRVTVEQTHRAVAGAVATSRSAAPTPPPTSSALHAPAPSAQTRIIGGAAHAAARAEVMAPGAVPPTAPKVSTPAPIAPPQRQFSQLPESAPVAQSAKTEIVSIEPLPAKGAPTGEAVLSDDELVAALASENTKQEVA